MKLNRLSLNVVGLNRIGLNRIGSPSRGSSSGSDRSYIDPEVLASLKAVCICYGKSNDDPDRAIIKNLVDPDNPFVISNAAFKLNSGFGEYKEDFTTWSKVAGTSIITDSKYVLTDEKAITNAGYFLWNRLAKDSFKVKISNIPNGGWMSYRYRITEEDTQFSSLFIREDGIYTLPATVAGSDVDFFISTASAPAKDWVGLTITQIPSFEGAFFTDGIDDLITSTKTVQEMPRGSSEYTVLSMIHHIDVPEGNIHSNTVRIKLGSWGTSNGITSFSNNKTGIYGYTVKKQNITVINNILGDKNDYGIRGGDYTSNLEAKFSVVGWIGEDDILRETASIAWYWTIIANKVLTTDQINQVIAYFNLDRTLNPDILCNTIKQGITNENHAEFGDKLIDFSGNGRDIQLNNIAWKGDSGIGKYEVDFLDSSIWNSSNSTITSSKIDCKNAISHIMLLYYSVGSKEYPDIPSFKVIKTGADIDYSYIDETGAPKSVKIVDGVNILPASHNTLYSGSGRFCGFGNPGMGNSVTITQIPSHAGGLCLDGINDFGKVTGMPIYKDYTFIIDREIISIGNTAGIVASKSEDSTDVNKQGAFLFEYLGAPNNISAWSFYKDNGKVANTDFTRGISYQSKYSYNGIELLAGTALDSDKLWLGILRDKDSRFANVAIYSLMSFPYTMSKFLIERQLKKHKLGTLYPDMVEFRPIAKSNVKWNIIEIWQGGKSLYRPAVNDYKTGIYLKKDSTINIYVKPKDADEVTKIVVNGTEYTNIKINSNGFYYVTLPITKSPQKIDITIDEYIRYEDIVQPYPVLLRFKDESGKEVSWGDKIKVGSSITRIGSFDDCNLLKGIYTVSNAKLNGSPLPSTPHVVEKSMVFTCTATWAFDNNEPKCILSPRLLRIPNSSYKILGHIPDISGHGNHGKINNSAYALASGANGYPYDYNNSSFWSDSGLAKVVSGELIEYFAVKNSTGFSNITSGVYKGEIKVTGVTKAISENKISRLRIYTNSTTDNELIDITQDGNYNIDIKGVGDANRVFFYAIPNNPNESIVVRLTEPIYIEQVGEYEGAYCLDGVDDFVTIPTTVGGKQVLMKVNWNSLNHVLYDQRNNAEAPFCIVAASGTIAYNQRNVGGNTYIDGILNNHILVDDLQAITHNIVLNNDYNVANSNSFIGTNYTKSIYAKMSLYDFMLFDNISTDDKIKELNEYVGIQGNVWRILTQLSNSTLISNETLIKNE
ncbi:hypothetical protein [Bacteroides ovatus]|uniref:hypothetical protein n=1 Tax=Bacteroides ovatus TaxID=28116 RepID=UPI002542E14D|nr:hypothetical protein [Bacteroides ovatus]WII05703.1 hypothetical protein OU990_08795 [Bacteroides ovatus]